MVPVTISLVHVASAVAPVALLLRPVASRVFTRPVVPAAQSESRFLAANLSLRELVPLLHVAGEGANPGESRALFESWLGLTIRAAVAMV